MRKKLIISIAVIALLLICLSGLLVYLHTQPRFPGDTEVFHTDVSGRFMRGAASRIQNALDEYSLTLRLGDEQVTFSAQELSMILDEAALEQLAVEMEQGTADADSIPVVTLDTAPVQQWLEARIQEDRAVPVGAHLVWNPEIARFELEGSAVGAYNDPAAALQLVTDAIGRLEKDVTLTEADYHVEYTDPEQLAAEQAALEQANALISRELAYNYYLRTGGYDTQVITPAIMGRWLIVGEDGLSLTWDWESIWFYAQYMSDFYSIEGQDYFITHDGRKTNLTVDAPTNVVDVQALSEDILSALTNMESGERQVPYSQQSKGWNYNGTYIEVSIGEQKLYGFVDGELVIETDIVTGCMHCDHDSPTGVYSVMNHGRNINLQDKPEYFVRYWMAVTLPYGLHDADGWRTEYGGEIYKTDGSGGCINVPRAVMKDVYETFQDGVPVVLYDESFVVPGDPAEDRVFPEEALAQDIFPDPEAQTFLLTFAGDCTLGCPLDQFTAEESFVMTVGQDYAYPFRNVIDYFAGDDFSIVNLENPLFDSDARANKRHAFRGPTDYVNILTQNSMDAVTIANNHVMDYGKEGYKSTVDTLTEAGVAYVEKDSTCIYTTPSGLTIGMYAVTYENLNKKQIVAAISELDANEDVDLVIFVPHWGAENTYRPNKVQKELAYAAIDAGADIVYGSHTQVLQPVEEYNDGFIFYSLGNFSFGGNNNPKDYDTALLQLSVTRNPDGSIYFGQLTIVPCSISSVTDRNNFQPTPYEEGSAEYERALSKILGTFTGPDLPAG